MGLENGFAGLPPGCIGAVPHFVFRVPQALAQFAPGVLQLLRGLPPGLLDLLAHLADLATPAACQEQNQGHN
jgi:hypothetical protein